MHRMSGRRNCHVGSYHHIVTNVNVSVINQDEIEVGIESVADVDVLAVSHVHGGFYPDGRKARQLQRSPPYAIIFRVLSANGDTRRSRGRLSAGFGLEFSSGNLKPQ